MTLPKSAGGTTSYASLLPAVRRTLLASPDSRRAHPAGFQSSQGDGEDSLWAAYGRSGKREGGERGFPTLLAQAKSMRAFWQNS